MKNNLFDPIDPSSHPARLARIKALSQKGYVDDGCVALFHCLKLAQEKGLLTTLEAALKELERLYEL